MKICPVRDKLFNVDRRRDMTNLIAVFRNYANEPKIVSDKSYRENKNIRFMCNEFFLSKRVPLCDKVEQYCTAVQATDKNMAHAHCMLDT